MSANLCYFAEPSKTFPNADDMATLMHFPLEIELDGKRKCLSGITEYTSCDDVIDTVVNHEYPRSRVVTSDYAMFRRSRGVETRLEGCDNMLKLIRSGRLGPGETLVIRFKKVIQSKSSHVCQPPANVITTFKSSLANPHLFESQARRVVSGSHDSSEVVSRNHISQGSNRDRIYPALHSISSNLVVKSYIPLTNYPALQKCTKPVDALISFRWRNVTRDISPALARWRSA